MRLIKQSVLYFQEGNSDKVYETDLCDVGNDKYVVNFRYGRRGASLKEGSKTPVPVSLQEAEKIYDSVVNEKIAKGYSGAPGSTARPLAADFLSAITFTQVSIESLPQGKEKAILRRLDLAVRSARPSGLPWKLSRVIWKAGEYKIKEAVPFIAQLFTKGDALHQYCCAWALIRCATPENLPVIYAIKESHPSPLIQRIAGAGLLNLETGDKKEELIRQYIKLLPPGLQEAIDKKELKTIGQLATPQQADHATANWRENLYLVSMNYRWLRPAVRSMLSTTPLRPGYFNQVRAVYKLAELLDDFETTGLLATRFERESEFFVRRSSSAFTDKKIYIEALEEYIDPEKELRQKNSRLAYSQKTRWYLHRRVMRRLEMFGEKEHTDYVRLATGILTSYKSDIDNKQPFSVFNYMWSGRNYTNVEIRFPANATAVLLHQILGGNNPDLELLPKKHIWRFIPEVQKAAKARAAGNTPASSTGGGIGGLFKKIAGLFSGKKDTPPPVTPQPVTAPEQVNTPPSFAPHLNLWNKLPQAYVQLLIEAEMDEVLAFASANLVIHPSFKDIKSKMDTDTLKKLVLSRFVIAADLGYSVIKERYLLEAAPADLIIAMLGSVSKDARNKAKEWTESNARTLLQDANFIAALLFTPLAEIRSWAKELIRTNALTEQTKQAVVGRAIATMMNATDNEDKSILNDAADTMFGVFSNELRKVDVNVISDLLHHPVSPVLLFGLRMVKLKKNDWKGEELKNSGLPDLLHHTYEPVRQQIVGLINELPDHDLFPFKDTLINAALSQWPDVRLGTKPALLRLVKTHPSYGNTVAETLMPFLVRKETFEGQHDYLADLLSIDLSDHLQHADKQTALNLLYGNYAPAQRLGIVILEKYTDPATLTIPQVIALANHESLSVRNWAWNFYNQQSARIKFEAATAIRLLESSWADTRDFARKYFREGFDEKDWEPEVLVGIADSVKPDVEAFGRELITKFFDDKNGPQYLLKLSQHPSEKMQLYATNYMERFATDNLENLKALEFYFRSVLTRVNKSRIAKDRIFLFLLTEGLKSEEAAKMVTDIITDISALTAIGDKAKCIDLLIQLKSIYALDVPLQVKQIETRF
ncbi:MAG: hypothetical protein DI535_23250 [Citrobacter freundii]|nr:MAG: hypothetical protein DI535_23250 [Citrobacter freundii]